MNEGEAIHLSTSSLFVNCGALNATDRERERERRDGNCRQKANGTNHTTNRIHLNWILYRSIVAVHSAKPVNFYHFALKWTAIKCVLDVVVSGEKAPAVQPDCHFWNFDYFIESIFSSRFIRSWAERWVEPKQMRYSSLNNNSWRTINDDCMCVRVRAWAKRKMMPENDTAGSMDDVETRPWRDHSIGIGKRVSTAENLFRRIAQRWRMTSIHKITSRINESLPPFAKCNVTNMKMKKEEKKIMNSYAPNWLCVSNVCSCLCRERERASACVLIGALAIIQHIVCRFGSIGIIHKKTRLFIDDGLWK